MAADDREATLELALNKATNPALREEDWDLINHFCELVNKELEGPQTAVRILAHKIQSPQERESLYALSTLEACVQACGRRFHQEIGKFRFLNEIIKVISPKYLGTKTTEKVKKKCIELLYSWHRGLPSEMKIADAYKMLKQQGIVKEDPTYCDIYSKPLSGSPLGTLVWKISVSPPPDRPRQATFEDEEKSKLLAKLLKSKNPEDLQAANRLIKNMVKQDAEKMEKTSRRINELEMVHNNAKLLCEMLESFSPETTTEAEKEMMKELHDSLQKLRPKLFRLASDTDEKDNDGLNDILKANDEVTQVMSQYKQKVEGVVQNGQSDSAARKDESKGASSLLDLGSDQSASSSYPAGYETALTDSSAILDDELLSLGLKSPTSATASGQNSGDTNNLLSDLDDIFSSASAATIQATQHGAMTNAFPVASGFPMVSAAGQPMGQAVTPVMGLNQPMGGVNVASMGMAQPMGQPVSVTAAFNQPGLTTPTIGVSHGLSQLQQQTMVQPQQVGSAFATSVFSQPSASGAKQQNSLPSYTGSMSQPAMTQQQQQAMQDLDSIGETLLKQTIGDRPPVIAPPPSKVPLSQMTTKPAALASGVPSVPPGDMSASAPTHPPPLSSVAGATSTTTVTSPATATATPKTTEVLPLTNLFVPLDKIQPGTAQPVTAYDKNNLKVLIHVAKDRPREDVSVMVVSVISTNTSPIKSFVFQAAVPKVMKVKLQPPSATDLPAFNPILPPAAITQVMLLANPQKEKIRLKFKVSYVMNEENFSDVGDVDTITVQ